MEARIVKQIDTEMDMEALGGMLAPCLKAGDLVYLAGELGRERPPSRAASPGDWATRER